jgi:hypothetical protein
MSNRPLGIPFYRLPKQSGQAIVTLSDGIGGRRDVLLGRYGTAESRVEYARVIAEWEVSGRRLALAIRCQPPRWATTDSAWPAHVASSRTAGSRSIGSKGFAAGLACDTDATTARGTQRDRRAASAACLKRETQGEQRMHQSSPKPPAVLDHVGLRCRRSGYQELKVVYTRRRGGKVGRRRECRNCGTRMSTCEREVGG